MLMATIVLIPVLGMAGLLLMGHLETRLRGELDHPATTPSPVPGSAPVAHLDTTAALDHPPGTAPA